MKFHNYREKKGIFITATDTDVGKTYISALLVKALISHGIRAGYYKPALSGAYKEKGHLIPGDAQFVCNTTGLSDAPSDLVSFMFEPSVSPHLAAQMEDTQIDETIVLQDYYKICKRYDFVVVEGCGGILCPLRAADQVQGKRASPLLLPDIIRLLGLHIIIVADAGLGTINVTLLTVEYAKSHNISIEGIILNRYESNNFLHRDNKKQIETLSGLPVLACVPSNALDLNLIEFSSYPFIGQNLL